MIAASEELGREMGKQLIGALGPYEVQSYGKAGIAGLAGEQEHANALLTTTFANPLREVVGGGKAWISSFTKRAPPGVPIDIPLAGKDALYVRSHYDGMTVAAAGRPMPDEIAVIFCVANRGRIGARVGGLKFEDMKGEDGLVSDVQARHHGRGGVPAGGAGLDRGQPAARRCAAGPCGRRRPS